MKKNQTKKNRKRFNVFKYFKASPQITNSVVGMIGFAIIFTVLSRSFFYGVYQYEVGDVVKEDIILEVSVVDVVATDAYRTKRASEIEPITYIDFSKSINSKKALNDYFSRLLEIKSTYSSDSEVMRRIYAGIERNNIYALDEEELMRLALLSTDRIRTIESYAIDITNQKMVSGLSESDLSSAFESIEAYVENIAELPSQDKALLLKFIEGALEVNLFIDLDKTNAKIEQELNQIDDIKLEAGTLLISAGELLEANTHAIMKNGDMLIESRQAYYLKLMGVFLLILSLWLIMHLFLWAFEKNTLLSIHRYGILMSLFFAIFIFSRFFSELSHFFIPIPAFAMLAGIMLSPMIVVFFGTFLVIFITFWTGLSTNLSMAYLTTVLISAILTRKVKQRSQIISTGFATAGVLSIFLIANVLAFKIDGQSLSIDLIYAVANGAISSVLTIGILPFYEGAFGILTPFKLLELSNPNRPLLKRLLIEAPGTYHHSVLVGNLAETAAHDIGANSLLTRVAAFYHDVGKLDRPFYFKENQLGNDNPHDKLPPQVSANIIRGHLSHGVELCEKNKLPQEIIEIIKSHHGTSIIKYFYHLEQKNNPNVDVARFLYPGPKPKSKEAVILMLADSIEAAVRTLEHPTKAALSELIDKIVDQKLSENQLSDSNISMYELEHIKASFINVLSGIFHERIVYPEVDLKHLSKETFDEPTNKA